LPFLSFDLYTTLDKRWAVFSVYFKKQHSVQK